jgi:hypothetical protein
MMKKIAAILFFISLASSSVFGAGKDLEVQGKAVKSPKPPFLFTLPSELQLIHSSSMEHPKENSLTRTFFFIREKKKQVEEMLILQIADRTNPEAGPMEAPPLQPYAEKRMYLKGKVKKGEVEVEYLTQLMAWNPEAPSLQPLIGKGMVIPSHWALQSQILFQSQLEHIVFIRYSRDIHSFELKVSNEGKNWDKASLSGNEKKAVESFQRTISGMMDSLRFQNP